MNFFTKDPNLKKKLGFGGEGRWRGGPSLSEFF